MNRLELVNPALWTTLMLGLVACAAAASLRPRLAGSTLRFAWIAAALLALPALTFALYYLHLFDQWVFFFWFRSLYFSELAAGFAGAVVGLWVGRAPERPAGIGSRLRTVLAVTALVGLIALPHAKPLLAPVDLQSMTDRWKDGVCLQTTPSTCGLASAATLLESRGVHVTERELACECHTWARGTENWYLVRALKARGVLARPVLGGGHWRDVPAPSIAGVELGGAGGPGHFVAILERTPGRIVIGDPLVGRLELSAEEAERRFHWTGFALALDPTRT